MATKTSLLGLTKPAYTDAADIAVLNGNFDLIDKAVGNGKFAQNLLDNSWFVNPINQRGASSYTNNGHTIDRWRDTTNSTTLITANGLTLQNNSTTSNAYWRQRLPTSVLTSGKTYTMAVEVGGVVCCGHAVVNSTSTATFYGANGLYLSCTGLTDNTYWTIQIALSAGKTFTGVRWAALYEGAYTAETLPAYVYKGYAAELAECQRYFQKGGQVVTVGTQYSPATKGIIRLRFCGMRSMPNITITGISSQGWGNIALEHLSKEWTSQVGTDCFQNYMIEGDSSFVGQTIGVEYEASADL